MTLLKDIVANLTPKQRTELFQQRALEILSRERRVPHLSSAVDWITRYFYIPELNGPMQLAPYQRAVLNEATRRDKDGKLVYSTIVWSDIKKSIKSCIAAAVALWRAWGLHWGSIVLVANDLKQADSRVGYYMRRAIELHPHIKPIVRMKNSGYRLDFPNKTFIESVAIDPSGEAGSNADMVIFSELWGAHQEAQKRMWVEMTLPPNKYGHSQRWVETYAGYTGASPLLEQLYEQGVINGRRLRLKGAPIDLEVYANDAARLLVLWNTKPRLSWQTPEYYAQEAATLPPNEFLRVHRNQWVATTTAFIPGEWWDACRGIIPVIQKNEPMIFGIDAGVSNDCFAITGVSRRGTQLYVRYCRVWYPPRGRKIDFSEPEAEIRRLAASYNVIEWAYDQHQLHDMASRLSRDGCGWFKVFSQSQPRLVADKHLYDLIRDRRITHPDHFDLNQHIKNADAETEKDKMRIVKRSESLKIDAAVALSMASFEATRLNVG